jgi:hypothetical protein
VLSSAEGSQHHLGMQEDRREDVDGGYIRVGQRVLERGVARIDAVCRG